MSRPAWARSSSTVPRAIRRPRWMMPMRSQSSSATSRLCVDMNTVAPPAASVAEDALQQPRAARIHADRRLVDDQDARRVHQRAGHHQALLHAVRVALRQLAAPFGEIEELEQALAARALGDRGGDDLVEAGDEVEDTRRRSASRRRAAGRGRSRTAPWRAAASRAGRGRRAATARRSAAAGPSSCGWWSSCRRRWGRGSRRSPPAAPTGSEDRRRVVAVAAS